jgi:hypothetical protein
VREHRTDRVKDCRSTTAPWSPLRSPYERQDRTAHSKRTADAAAGGLLDVAPSRRSLGLRSIQSNRVTTTHPRPDEPGARSSNSRMNQREEPTIHASGLLRTQRRRRGAVLAVPALFPVAAVSLGACSPSAATTGSSTGGTALAVRQASPGTILTDGRGFTLYAFDADKGPCRSAPAPAPQRGPRTPHGFRPPGRHRGDAVPRRPDHPGDGSTAFGACWDTLTATGKDVSGGS